MLFDSQELSYSQKKSEVKCYSEKLESCITEFNAALTDLTDKRLKSTEDQEKKELELFIGPMKGKGNLDDFDSAVEKVKTLCFNKLMLYVYISFISYMTKHFEKLLEMFTIYKDFIALKVS